MQRTVPNITQSQILERLDKLGKLKKQIADETDLYVLIARRNGMSWDRIGIALGLTSGNGIREKYIGKAYRTADVPRATKKRPERTHCIHGHKLTEENSFRDTTNNSIRCRKCRSDQRKKYNAKRKKRRHNAQQA